MLFRKKELPLPTSKDNSALAEKFSVFFNDKIAKIMTQLEASSVADSMYTENDYITTARHNFFLPVTEEDARRIIMKSLAKACELDPIPTKLLKDNLDILLPTLTSIMCKSLSTGEFSDNLKEALLRPLLKAMQLDHEVFPNFQPVSNLSYISKLIERIVGEQLDFFASSSGNMEPLQSAYHNHHSTETALLKIQMDILDAMDNKSVTCLVLLDLSAAFDTVSHCELINRLKYRFGLGGVVLQWITNYLMDRTQCIVIDANGNDPTTGSSGFTSVKQGVPQGSSLGPKLFMMFLSPVGDICKKHNIIFHFYTDDSQIYMTFKPALDSDKEECLCNLEHCIDEIRTWIATNYLKFNMGKTEFVVFGNKHQLTKADAINMSIRVGQDTIQCKQTARNLGYFADSEMKCTQHVNKVSSACFLMLWKIAQIRWKLDVEMTKTIIQGLVISKMDYCNSLLGGMYGYNMKKLQCIQNAAAMIVFCQSKYCHITPLLKELHWLQITEWIDYKIIVIVYCCRKGLAPNYLSIMIVKSHNRPLRSTTNNKLPVNKFNTAFVNNRSFKALGPRIWNNLPDGLRNIEDINIFKAELKTFLFRRSYT